MQTKIVSDRHSNNRQDSRKKIAFQSLQCRHIVVLYIE